MASLTADQIEDIEQRLRSGAYRDDPRAVFTPLRESAPVYFSKAWQAWLITRHADVEQALRDTETFTSTGRLEKLLEPLDPKLREAVAPLIGHFSAGLQHSDPPEHTRIHGLVNRALAPAVVNRMRDVIQSFVDGLLDPLLASGRMDLVRDFAEPLPVQVLGHVLGFTREECERFRHWDDDQVAVLGSRSGRPELVPQARRSVDSMVGWLRQVTEVRRANPRDDLFSKLVAGLDAGTLRNEPELHGTYNAVLIGGHETTTGLISSAIMLLVRHPDQLERLRADSSLMPTAIEEFLRYEPPLQTISRVAARDVSMGPATIRKGDLVMVMVASANHDPEAFDAPERLDVGRRPNRHVSFGYGVHFCIGASLARLEGSIALSTLLRRMDRIRIGADALQWRTNDIFRVLEALPIEFEGAA